VSAFDKINILTSGDSSRLEVFAYLPRGASKIPSLSSINRKALPIIKIMGRAYASLVCLFPNAG
jgi:hypothetical protein